MKATGQSTESLKQGHGVFGGVQSLTSTSRRRRTFTKYSQLSHPFPTLRSPQGRLCPAAATAQTTPVLNVLPSVSEAKVLRGVHFFVLSTSSTNHNKPKKEANPPARPRGRLLEHQVHKSYTKLFFCRLHLLCNKTSGAEISRFVNRILP
ncbi:hypothetical protein NEUTE2DRAFT_53581 [Neurospora tetrasperma FGSC 2509]|nr:hypothetical protein NEUTE2DRAFT_53581 [Neurospora tetrasperma FGSC 2509]